MDTLAINEKLTAAGAPKPQARAHAQIHAETANEIKEDLKAELPTKADIQALRVAIAEAETRLTWRIVGAVVAIVGVTVASVGVMLTILFQALST